MGYLDTEFEDHMTVNPELWNRKRVYEGNTTNKNTDNSAEKQHIKIKTRNPVI
jgi:hypothetical protein